MYDFSTGRFLQRDPAGQSVNGFAKKQYSVPNEYQYGENAVTVKVDANGMQSEVLNQVFSIEGESVEDAMRRLAAERISVLEQDYQSGLYLPHSGIIRFIGKLKAISREVNYAMVGSGAPEEYDMNTNTVVLRPNSTHETVVHELTHALDTKHKWNVGEAKITTNYEDAEGLAYGAQYIMQNAKSLNLVDRR